MRCERQRVDPDRAQRRKIRPADAWPAGEIALRSRTGSERLEIAVKDAEDNRGGRAVRIGRERGRDAIGDRLLRRVVSPGIRCARRDALNRARHSHRRRQEANQRSKRSVDVDGDGRDGGWVHHPGRIDRDGLDGVVAGNRARERRGDERVGARATQRSEMRPIQVAEDLLRRPVGIGGSGPRDANRGTKLPAGAHAVINAVDVAARVQRGETRDLRGERHGPAAAPARRHKQQQRRDD